MTTTNDSICSEFMVEPHEREAFDIAHGNIISAVDSVSGVRPIEYALTMAYANCPTVDSAGWFIEIACEMFPAVDF